MTDTRVNTGVFHTECFYELQEKNILHDVGEAASTMNILFCLHESDFWDPLGLMQISSVCRHRGDKTYLAVLSHGDIFRKIEEIRPDVIAYGATTSDHENYLRINREIKARHKNIFTIMGGPHPTFFPEVVTQGDLDAICIGEGEQAFVELLDHLEKGKDISGLKNIMVRGGRFNGLNLLIQDLDSLPFPDRELIYTSPHMHREKVPVMSFMTSRGCPYNCTYCFNHAFKEMYRGQGFMRRRSVDNVLQEIAEVRDHYQIRFVKFYDDLFVTKKNDEWLREFAEKYPERIGLPFLIYNRFDMMTPDIAELLKKAGCTAALMSIESANPEIREKILGRRMGDETILQGAGYCREKGINVISYTMLGLPKSTLSDDINAVDFSIKAGISIPEFPIFHPLPKTELCNMCLEEGYVEESFIKDPKKGGFNLPSILSCFSPKEKNAQLNISALGPIAIRYPFLRNPIMNHLIHLPHNRLFVLIYTLEKVKAYTSMVYKTEYSFREILKIIKRTLKIESARRNED
jgi:radical SAM superfamily enzyme YgiQ (UPF0313 family)